SRRSSDLRGFCVKPGLEFLERQSVVLSGWDIANGDSGGGCIEALDSPGYPCCLRVLELLPDIIIIQINFDANPFTAETFAKLLSLLMEMDRVYTISNEEDTREAARRPGRRLIEFLVLKGRQA